MPGAAGDLGGGHPRVQRQGHAGVPQVVGPPGERGGLLGGGQRGDASVGPDGAVGAVLDEPAAGGEEDPPVGGGAVPLEVGAEQLVPGRRGARPCGADTRVRGAVSHGPLPGALPS